MVIAVNSKKNKIIMSLFLLLVLGAVGCDYRYGFIESNFILAEDSRLPKWVSDSSIENREYYKVEFTFHTHPFFNKVKIVVSCLEDRQDCTQEYIGDYYVHEKSRDKPRNFYPSYLVISVNGVDEVFEHQKRGNILSVGIPE